MEIISLQCLLVKLHVIAGDSDKDVSSLLGGIKLITADTSIEMFMLYHRAVSEDFMKSKDTKKD